MLVLGAIPEIQLQRLRRAAPARFALAHAATWETALATIRARPVELAVVDPLLSGTASAKEIEQLRHRFPSLPLIVYTALTPRTAAVLLALGQQGVWHVVFARYDDHPRPRRATSPRPLACARRTGWCRTRGSRPTTSPGGCGTPRPRRCSSTRPPTSGSRGARCALPSRPPRHWNASCGAFVRATTPRPP